MSNLADAGRVGWKCLMRPVGIMRPLALFTAFLKIFSACFASFSMVFVAGFSIVCPVLFLEDDIGSPRPINRGQFRVDGDEDG